MKEIIKLEEDMSRKENFLSDIKSGETIKISLMVMKVIFNVNSMKK